MSPELSLIDFKGDETLNCKSNSLSNLTHCHKFFVGYKICLHSCALNEDYAFLAQKNVNT